MVHVYSDRRMLEHVTPRDHPESPERLRAILDALKKKNAAFDDTAREAARSELERLHTKDEIERLDAAERAGGGMIDADTWCGPGSTRAARLAAGAAIDAVRAVVKGPETKAFCAIRPPGHHARPTTAMGFCLFGNIALAAREAVDALGLQRVLIVDWDVHHGNGTQEMFYDEGRIGFVSAHRYPYYPGTGAANETGTGAGLGLTLNVPVRYGTSRRDYRSAFRAALETMADKVKPELVLISAGFDAHREDPIGDLGLEVEDFTLLTEMVRDVAKTHAAGRIVSVLEGGYNVAVLAECVLAHLDALGRDEAAPR